MGIYFTSKLISRKTKKLRARNNTVNHKINSLKQRNLYLSAPR